MSFSQDEWSGHGRHDFSSVKEPSIREKVQSVIDLIRPAVQADGGDIELVDVSQVGSCRFDFTARVTGARAAR